MKDRNIIFGTAFLRALATGMISVLLGIYLSRLQFSSAEIGFVITEGLAGGAIATLLTTLYGDRLGRRKFLIGMAVFCAAGGVVLALVSSVGIVGTVAFLGMINGMGRDRSAFLVIEQAILPALTSDQNRTRHFAWYNVFQDMGHSVGALLAGVPVLFRMFYHMKEVDSLRTGVLLYGFLMFLTIPLYLKLSSNIGMDEKDKPVTISPQSRNILWKISSLFVVDGLAGGFLTASLLSYFFFKRFGVGEEVIGILFFGVRIANAVSHLGSAWLAKRIGLVNTMVFTHIPSSLLLMTVPFSPTFSVAAILFLFREGLVEMDVPARQSYVMAVIQPEERTVASGVTHLVRVCAWSVAPFFAGLLMQGVSLKIPLLAGAGMKLVYDGLLYKNFRKLKPPEENISVFP